MLHAVSLRERPSAVRLLEVYASQAAYQAHIQTPYFLKYKQNTADMVLELRLVDVDPILVGTSTE